MPYSKSKSNIKRKQQLRTRTKRLGPRIYRQRQDIETRILISKCDLRNDDLPKEGDNIQYRINILDEIDDSFESDYDKSTYESGPKLILCEYCQKEYLLPSYQ